MKEACKVQSMNETGYVHGSAWKCTDCTGMLLGCQLSGFAHNCTKAVCCHCPFGSRTIVLHEGNCLADTASANIVEVIELVQHALFVLFMMSAA